MLWSFVRLRLSTMQSTSSMRLNVEVESKYGSIVNRDGKLGIVLAFEMRDESHLGLSGNEIPEFLAVSCCFCCCGVSISCFVFVFKTVVARMCCCCCCCCMDEDWLIELKTKNPQKNCSFFYAKYTEREANGRS